MKQRLNDFFVDHDEPAPLDDGVGGAFRAFGGPIGSGEAVVAHRESEVRQWLRQYNDKVLAVETEAYGVAQGFYEATAPDLAGWLAIRGISDYADENKADAHHVAASRNAAKTLEALVPYLT